MKLDAGVGIKNKFTIVIEDICTKEKREYTAHNIVLNSMWSRLVNFQTFFTYIHFGTGTGTFNDPARTTLYNHLGTKSATTEYQTRALPVSQWRRKIVLNPEEYVGQTITEIGVAYGSNASNLVTHAAPKDAEGNPISIGPKKDTEVITIYADMYFVLAENMYGDKIRWVTPLSNNNLMNYLMGASMSSIYYRVTRSALFSNGTSPGATWNSSSISWQRDVANRKVYTPIVRLGISDGNGEIRGFGIGYSNNEGIFRGHFPIPGVYTGKQVVETLGESDGVETNYNLTWIDPQNLIIKVDGLEVNSNEYTILPVKRGDNVLDKVTAQWLSGGSGDPARYFNYETDSSLNITGTIGVDVGSERGNVPINKIRVYTGDQSLPSSSYSRRVIIKGSNNPDFSESVHIYTFDKSERANRWLEASFTLSPGYRYYVIEIDSSSSSIRQIELISAADQVVFKNPLTEGAVITAEYDVDYIPKDSEHVLDLQAGIQFGEVI